MPTSPLRALALSALLLAPLPARGDFTPFDYFTRTYYLDRSNKLADGVKYGTVQVEGYFAPSGSQYDPPPVNGLLTHQVRLTYTAFEVPEYHTEYGNVFGFTAVGFGADPVVNASQVSVVGLEGYQIQTAVPFDGIGTFGWA